MSYDLLGYRPPFRIREDGLMVDADEVEIDPKARKLAVMLRRLPRYTGPNRKIGDHYVRELRRIGTEHRQVVEFDVVGTGRVERMSRTEFERRARPV